MTSAGLPNYIANVLLNKIKSTDHLVDAIRAAESLGALLWMNNVGVYSLAATEHELTRRLFFDYDKKYVSLDPCQGGVAFVVTKPYLAGGHTRLMERLASMLNNECELFISDTADVNVIEKMSLFFHEVILFNDNVDVNEKIYSIARRLSNYNYVILNIHPDDVISVLACALAKKINNGLKVFFINHADHAFSFGCTVVDVWLEISIFGEKISKENRALPCATSFLGIPLDAGKEYENIQFSSPKHTDVKTIFTSGSGWKYKKTKEFSIFPYIIDVLNTYPSATIFVVGVNIVTDYWWWWTKFKSNGRLKFFRTLPYEQFIQLTKRADIYIDSHPIPGGTAFVEQALNGVYCCGLKSPIQGYTPLELMKNEKWNCVEKSVNDESIRRLIVETHSFNQVKKRFLGCLFGDELYLNPMVNHLEWSGDLSFFVNKNVSRYPKRVLLYLFNTPRLFFLSLLHSPIITMKSLIIEIVRYLFGK